ncbi:hypothetical protein [Subtercola frigoramans]|uniref:Uncharacterized protein n=1 Tax=Subtercola frigoramans TaxID=120298 RepID=A0ABS2L2G2_9MICO|nr:hypothetical protein [Subtercola frigoramans]MBM7471272.1 hypothetical protein [Subtercola frigoramans]
MTEPSTDDSSTDVARAVDFDPGADMPDSGLSNPAAVGTPATNEEPATGYPIEHGEDGDSAAGHPPRHRRRRILQLAGAAVVAAAVIGGFWGWSVAAENRYEAAASSLQSQLTTETSASHAFDARLADVRSLAKRIHSVVDSPTFAAETVAEAGALQQSLTTMDALAAAPESTPPSAAEVAALATPPAGYRPPWQLTTEAEQLEGRARASQQQGSDLVTAAKNTADAETSLNTAESAFFSAAATEADQLIASDPLSNRSLQVALIRLTEQARNPSMSMSHDGAFLASMSDAESQVRASQATHQAELDDPAWAVRREIENYARSLSNGVALEFIWSPEVSGLGANWLSGTTQSFDTDGGYAIINLNYTVETAWYDGRDARALVAHEVGHSQVYRCAPLFNSPEIKGQQEVWATAWSISQGFDIPGSGIEAYGRPSDAQVAVAAQCR